MSAYGSRCIAGEQSSFRPDPPAFWTTDGVDEPPPVAHPPTWPHPTPRALLSAYSRRHLWSAASTRSNSVVQLQLRYLAGPQQGGAAASLRSSLVDGPRGIPQPAGRRRVQRRDQLLEAPRLQVANQPGRAVRHHRHHVLGAAAQPACDPAPTPSPGSAPDGPHPRPPGLAQGDRRHPPRPADPLLVPAGPGDPGIPRLTWADTSSILLVAPRRLPSSGTRSGKNLARARRPGRPGGPRAGSRLSCG